MIRGVFQAKEIVHIKSRWQEKKTKKSMIYLMDMKEGSVTEAEWMRGREK